MDQSNNIFFPTGLETCHRQSFLSISFSILITF